MDSRPDSLKCGLFNIQSVRNKTLEFREFIKDNNYDIMILTKTWLKGTVADKAIVG